MSDVSRSPESLLLPIHFTGSSATTIMTCQQRGHKLLPTSDGAPTLYLLLSPCVCVCAFLALYLNAAGTFL